MSHSVVFLRQRIRSLYQLQNPLIVLNYHPSSNCFSTMTGKKEDDKRKSINMRDDDDVGGSCGDYSLPEGVTSSDALQILQSLVKNKVLNSDQIKQFAPKNNLESQKKRLNPPLQDMNCPKLKNPKHSLPQNNK